MIKRILATIGAGRLIGVTLIAGIAVGALVAAPLFAAASDSDDEPEETPDVTALSQLLEEVDGITSWTPFADSDETHSSFGFGGGSDEMLIEGFFNESGDGGAGFRFEMSFSAGDGIRFGADLIETVAELTGTDEEAVAEALEEGQTLAEYAEAHGVSADALLDELMSDAEERLAEAIQEDDLTEEEADLIRTELREHLSDLINGDGPFGGFAFGHPDVPGELPFIGGIGSDFAVEFDPIETVADLTGTEIEEVFDALENGQTPAEFAAEYGVSEDDLVAAIMADAEERATEAVADGDLSQDEADEILARLEERARAILNGEGVIFHHRIAPGAGSSFAPFGGIFTPGACDDTDDGDAPEGESTPDEI